MSIEINGPDVPRGDEVLTDAALELVALLHREIDGRRKELLARREELQAELDAGGTLDFLEQTKDVREGDWQVSPPPPALRKRWVEITGPTSAKMVINALNSGLHRLHGGLRGRQLAVVVEHGRRPGEPDGRRARRRWSSTTRPRASSTA